MLDQKPIRDPQIHADPGGPKSDKPKAWLLPLAGALLIVGLMGAYYAHTWGSVESFVIAIDHCEKLFCDFTNHYYPMGRSLFWTETPVQGYYYTPFFALLLVPFGAIPLTTSLWLWGALQALLMIALFVVPGHAFLKRSRVSFYLYIFLVASSLPVLHNLKWGQVSILMTLCALAALILYRKDRPIAAAILLALATWIKYFTGIFLIVPLLKRDRKFLLAFLAASLVFGLILPLGVLGLKDGVSFYRQVNQGVKDTQSWVPTDINSQYLVHVVWRLAGGEEATIDLGAVRLIGYLIAAASIALVYASMRARVDAWELWAFVLLFASLPFLLSTSWPHYFVYLPFCQTVLAENLLAASPVTWRRSLPKAVPLVGSMVLSSAFLFNALGGRSVYSGGGFLFFANLLVLGLAYWELVPQVLRRAA